MYNYEFLASPSDSSHVSRACVCPHLFDSASRVCDRFDDADPCPKFSCTGITPLHVATTMTTGHSVWTLQAYMTT